MKNIINIIVKDEENGSRIDSFISKKEKKLSRTRIKNLIIQKNLKLNDILTINPSQKVVAGDKINLVIPKPIKASLKPYKFKIDIVYEDNDLLVLNKPAGIVMHPGAGNYENTVVNALVNHCGKNLYKTLRIIKKKKFKSIAVEKIPNKGFGEAINDRLFRAAKF